jgi:hypothetical protein
VATSVEVLNGTIARVELTEDTNQNGVIYTVSGGNVAGSNGRAWDVTLGGGGDPTTIRYRINGQADSPAGSVQFRVTLRSVTAPPNSPPPAPTMESPTTLARGLPLTFSERANR